MAADLARIDEVPRLKRADITDEIREQVKNFAMAGMTQAQVGEHYGLDQSDVSRWFRKEWNEGTDYCHAKVAGALFTNATESNNVAAQIFWMKARMKWRENHEQQIEVTHRYVVEAPKPVESADEWSERYGVIDVTPNDD